MDDHLVGANNEVGYGILCPSDRCLIVGKISWFDAKTACIFGRWAVGMAIRFVLGLRLVVKLSLNF